jgi:hypothetical protein
MSVPEPVVHLMIIDPDDLRADDVFSACCGYNWRSLITTGVITARHDLVTCPGRPLRAPGSGKDGP